MKFIGLALTGVVALSASSDTLGGGEWQVTATLGSPQTSSSSDGTPQVTESCHAQSFNSIPFEERILLMINRSQCNADKALFSNGVIKGNLVCSGDPGGAEHKEPISGTYGPDFANVTLDFPMYGIAVRETFRAKRLRDCSVEGQQ